MVFVAMSPAVRAEVDRRSSCYTAVSFEGGVRRWEDVHERRSDGSCACGKLKARPRG